MIEANSATVTAEFDAADIGEITVIMIGAESGHGSRQTITAAAELPSTGSNSTTIPALILTAALGSLIALSSRRRF